MAALQEYKCPCCGGAVNFDSGIQKLKCPYCDTEFEMSTVEDYNKELDSDASEHLDWNTEHLTEWSNSDAEGIRVYVCQSCGGEIVADDTTAASTCPFCDNPIVMKGNVAGGLKPELIIPFKLDKQAAKTKFDEFLKGKTFLPRIFKSQNHIDEIKGIYVPYWLFDSTVDAKMRYKATKERRYEDEDNTYVETSYYSIIREGSLSFEHVPADGSSKMPDDLMESLEPYDFKDAVAFNPGYLAGYLADKYDVDDKQSVDRVNERMRNSTSDAFRETVIGYASVLDDGGIMNMRDGKTSYAMYPVWILNTTYKGEKYVFAMNGQTGKFVGDLPCDKKVANLWLFGTTILFSAIAFIINLIINL